MSMQAINYAMTLPVEEPGPRLLLILIAHHVNWKTGTMFVSQTELAAEAKASERSVRRWCGVLEEAGFITKTERRAFGTGRRDVDEIELVGYLDWQEVIEKGGTIPDPSTRGKVLKTPPDNLAGSEEPTGQICAANRTKTASQPDNGVRYKKTTLTNNNHLSARECASHGARTPALNVVPQIKISRGDLSWDDWIAWMSDNDRRDLVNAAQEAGQIVCASRWPTDSSPPPRIDQTAAIERRKLGEVE